MEKYAGNRNMEKEEIIKEIKNFLTGKKKCNPSTIKDELKKKNILAENLEQAFGTKSITDILKEIQKIEFEKDEHGTSYVKLKNSSEQDASVKNVQKSENSVLKKEPSKEDRLPLRKRIEKLLSFIGKDLIEKLQDGEHILCYDCQKSYYVPFSAPAKKSLEFYCKNCLFTFL